MMEFIKRQSKFSTIIKEKESLSFDLKKLFLKDLRKIKNFYYLEKNLNKLEINHNLQKGFT
mgnify:CR=1 FL=1